MSRQALEMALEALESAEPKYTKQRADQKTLGGSLDYWKLSQDQRLKAITAIKEALAQQETPYKIGQRIAKTGGGISHLWSAVSQDGEIAEAERGFKEALAQPEQKPCRHRIADIRNEAIKSGYMCMDCGALFGAYTTPPQRKPLTRDDIIRMAKQAGFQEPEPITSGDNFRCSPDLAYLVALVEAAHGIKATGVEA